MKLFSDFASNFKFDYYLNIIVKAFFSKIIKFVNELYTSYYIYNPVLNDSHIFFNAIFDLISCL